MKQRLGISLVICFGIFLFGIGMLGGAWNVFREKANGEIGFSAGIQLNLSGVEVKDGKNKLLLESGGVESELAISGALPGENYSVKSPYVSAAEKSMPCFLRVRLRFIAEEELSSEEVSQLFSKVPEFGGEFCAYGCWNYYTKSKNFSGECEELEVFRAGETLVLFGSKNIVVCDESETVTIMKRYKKLRIEFEIEALQVNLTAAQSEWGLASGAVEQTDKNIVGIKIVGDSVTKLVPEEENTKLMRRRIRVSPDILIGEIRIKAVNRQLGEEWYLGDGEGELSAEEFPWDGISKREESCCVDIFTEFPEHYLAVIESGGEIVIGVSPTTMVGKKIGGITVEKSFEYFIEKYSISTFGAVYEDAMFGYYEEETEGFPSGALLGVGIRSVSGQYQAKMTIEEEECVKEALQGAGICDVRDFDYLCLAMIKYGTTDLKEILGSSKSAKTASKEICIESGAEDGEYSLAEEKAIWCLGKSNPWGETKWFGGLSRENGVYTLRSKNQTYKMDKLPDILRILLKIYSPPEKDGYLTFNGSTFSFSSAPSHTFNFYL